MLVSAMQESRMLKFERLPSLNEPQTIRFRIACLVGLALLPVILLSIWVIYNFAVAKRQLIEQQRLEVTHRISAAFDREIAGPLGMLTGLAGADDLINGQIGDFRAQAARLAARPDLVRIWAFRRDGSAEPGSDTMPNAGQPVPPPPECVEQVFGGRRAVSPVRGTGVGGARVVIAVPVSSEGKVLFGVAAEMSVAQLSAIFQKEGLEPTWISGVVDREGRFVARSLDISNRLGTVARPELMKRAQGTETSGVYENVTYEGLATANAFHRSDLTGWTTAVAVPRSELSAPVFRAIGLIIAGSASTLAISLLLSSILARRISEPILSLSRYATALAAGQAGHQAAHRLVELDEVRAALEAAMAKSAHLSALVASSGDAIISMNLDGTVRTWNKGAEDLFGFTADEIVGKPKSLIIPDSRLAEFNDHRAHVLRGETLRAESERCHRDGRLVPVSLNSAPIYSPDGRIVAISSIIHDITDRKAAEEHTQFLMRELAHRSKNQLAVIQSLAGQTARRARNVDDFVVGFRHRLQALAASNDLLVRQNWRPVLLGDLVAQQLATFDDARGRNIEASGPPVRLPVAAAEGIGLALHELATNSVKYGALSVPQGHVSISWSVSSDGSDTPRLKLEWRDSGGPAVEPPTAKGFGTQVLEKLVARAVGGTTTTLYLPEGLHWTLDCDVPAV